MFSWDFENSNGKFIWSWILMRIWWEKNSIAHKNCVQVLICFSFSLQGKPGPMGGDGAPGKVGSKVSADWLHVTRRLLQCTYSDAHIGMYTVYTDWFGSFTPIVFSTTGGMGAEAQTFYRRLAGQLSIRKNMPFHLTMKWLRTQLSVILLRSSLLCLRGSRSLRRRRLNLTRVHP